MGAHFSSARVARAALVLLVLSVAAAWAAATSPAKGQVAPPAYRVTGLYDPCAGIPGPYYDGVWGYSINNAGDVVGEAYYICDIPIESIVTASVWGADGSLVSTFHSPYQAAQSSARDINDSGDVAGWVGLWFVVGSHAVLVKADGSITDLGTVYAPGPCDTSQEDCWAGSWSTANGINASDQVVGASAPQPWSWGVTHAFLYTNGGMVDLGTLGGAMSTANAINDAGLVVGTADTASNLSHAFSYDAGAIHDLGTLGGLTSVANAVNNKDEIVGWADTAAGLRHAYLFKNGKMSDLGTLGIESAATAINDKGEIVGTFSDGTGSTHAVIVKGMKMRDLNDLVPADTPVLTNATAINDAGQIVAWGPGPGWPYGPRTWLLTLR
jgi:probable HAF family extracellular repeat protein